MPPLALHTAVAKEIAENLRSPALDGQRGTLYLGSTAPDIRVITRWDRKATHFFDLAHFEEQSGVAGLLQAYPALAEPSRLSAGTVSFVAGYISHLVMDETWISDVYRPFFGERSPLKGDLRANVMDRALQYALDQDRRRDHDLIGHIVGEVTRAELALDVDFLDGETVGRWREIVVDVVQRPPDWERFRYAAARHLNGPALEDPEALSELVRSLPDLVDETVKYLSPERVQAFMEDSLARGVEAVKEYLCA